MSLSCHSTNRASSLDGDPDLFLGNYQKPVGQACLNEGEMVRCTHKASLSQGILTCWEGVQKCQDGQWTECGDKDGLDVQIVEWMNDLPAPIPGITTPPMVRTQSLSLPSSCNSPCDPGCTLFNETPPNPITPTGTPTSVFYEGSFNELKEAVPGGFINKGNKSNCSTIADCQFDFHCVSKTCVPWKKGETNSATGKPDLTMGIACALNDTPMIPVCNRGTATAPAGLKIYVMPGNSPQFPVCTPDAPTNTCMTDKPIKPGECVIVSNCPGLSKVGDKTLMVNPPSDPAWIDEYTCSNNWTVWHGGATCTYQQLYEYSSLTYTQVYEGVCANSNETPEWRVFSYQTETPGDSKITFQARTATTTSLLSSSAWVDLAVAKILPAPDTQNCLLAGPSPCPIDLTQKISDQDRFRRFLELSMTLTPTSTLNGAPILKDWKVSYTCIPME